MHVLRLLRVFIPLLIVAAIVAGVVVTVTSRKELQRTRREVDAAWAPLRPVLDVRYGALATADDAVRSTPGPLHQLVAQVDRAYADWRDLEQRNGSVASQVGAANKLEALGRRLVVTARAAPRLAGNASALAAVNAFASLASPPAAAPFDAAVSRYEDERDRPARRVPARILGFGSIPSYDASGSA